MSSYYPTDRRWIQRIPALLLTKIKQLYSRTSYIHIHHESLWTKRNHCGRSACTVPSITRMSSACLNTTITTKNLIFGDICPSVTSSIRQVGRRIMSNRSSTATMTTTTTTTTKPTTATHYTSHDAQSYESAYFYEHGPYMEYIKDLVQNKYFGFIQQRNDELVDVESDNYNSNQSRPNKTLLDIGGGTGNFTKMILDGTHNINAIVIDPFLEQSASIDTTTTKNSDDTVQDGNDNNNDHNNNNTMFPKIQFVKEPAEAFIQVESPPSQQQQQQGTMVSLDNETNNNSNNIPFWKHNYDYVLLKEVVHHFHEMDRVNIFRGLYNGFNPTSSLSTSTSGCSLLIITRPQNDIDYPLWDDARMVWAQNQPSVDQLRIELTHAGFVNVQYTIESYPCTIPIQRWQNMIQSRFWSTFANFTDTELREACQVIEQNECHRIYNGIIHFEDRLVFLSATKVI